VGAFASALPPKARRVAPRAERRPASAHTHEERRLSRPRDGAQRVRCATINSQCCVRGLGCCERLGSFHRIRIQERRRASYRCKSTEGRPSLNLHIKAHLFVAGGFILSQTSEERPNSCVPYQRPEFFHSHKFTAFCDARCRDGVRPPLLELFGRQLITRPCHRSGFSRTGWHGTGAPTPFVAKRKDEQGTAAHV
jgi:hypothetical protein